MGDNGVTNANANATSVAAAMAIVASRTSNTMACSVLWNREVIINLCADIRHLNYFIYSSLSS